MEVNGQPHPTEKGPCTQWKGRLVGLRVSVHSFEMRKISFPCHKSNHSSSAAQTTAIINSSSSECVTYDFKMLAACTN